MELLEKYLVYEDIKKQAQSIRFNSYESYLNQMIEDLKKELEDAVSKYGLSHSIVIDLSQELDKYIVECQKRKLVSTKLFNERR
ncbi:aspartyl-phosphate phosphatase Spo0E family protein [Brevibacillus antibioticus]|nr:aspartyl-phosphate phosphatase Spo0E family protein [Brevibacillus antibioticus]